MSFKEIFSSNKKPGFSLEFFPPREEALLPNALVMVKDLSELGPDFMTVTYGAGGATRGLTQQMVSYIHNDLGKPAVAHLTCVGHSIADIEKILGGLASCGIAHVLALRGDPPKGETVFKPHPQGFSCARDLAAFISKRGDFSVAVAGYPEGHQEAVSLDADVEYLKEKVDAGAEVIITQLFFEADLYFRFVDKVRTAGITVAVLPGIMPIGNVDQVKRFTQLCGASIPKSLTDSLNQLSAEKGDVTKFGIDNAVQLARLLLAGGAPGIHLYTLNKSLQIRPIVEQLGLGRI